MVFSAVVFFAPEGGGYFLETTTSSGRPAEDPAAHCAGLVLHAVLLDPACHGLSFGLDAKFWGVVAMGASVVIFAFLPWLDRSPVKSIRYRGPITKVMLTIFVIASSSWAIWAPCRLRRWANWCPRSARSSTSASSSACRGGPMDKFKPVPDRVTMK
jgi:ubiquinol-cytochrome c reductase cytochrome b subunit